MKQGRQKMMKNNIINSKDLIKLCLLFFIVYLILSFFKILNFFSFLLFIGCLYFLKFIIKFIIFHNKKVQIEENEVDLLDWIDTTESAEFFAKLLNKNMTFFLNGEWGAGKTEYLKQVEKITKTNNKQNFVYLNLWNVMDERTVINIAFSDLHPVINYLFKILIVFSVVISILITPAINLNLSEFFVRYIDKELFNNWIVPLASLIALFAAVWQFFKYKTDNIYYKFFKTSISAYFLKNKVLIIDDFDRISQLNQEGAYKLFNCLNGKLPIIFVGEYDKIKHEEDKYLQKIINQKIELPYSLYPDNIWNEYFIKLGKQLSIRISPSFVSLFIEEKRNLRERKMFHYYVTQELEVRGKRDYVQIEQQLVIIFLYLFYPSEYKRLVNSEEVAVVLAKENWEILRDILTNQEGYPKPFSNERKAYFMYEKNFHLTEVQGQEILDQPNLQSIIIENGGYNNDVYEYVTRNLKSLEHEKREKLFEAAIENILINRESALVHKIIEHKNKEIINKIGSLDHNLIINEWTPILDSYSFDFSQRLYFFERFINISFYKLSQIYTDLELESDDFLNGKNKEFYFLTYLSKKNQWRNFLWPENYWEALDKVFHDNSAAYLYILKILHLIDINDETQEIIAYQKLYNNITEKDVEGSVEAFKKIKSNLEKLEDFTVIVEEKNSLNLF
ncbi:protein MraZ [Enterococcus faecalis]|nr:protein MraZ [Enterococcus faecalis]